MSELILSRKERARLEVFARVRDGELSVAKAAEPPGLSERQAGERVQVDGSGHDWFEGGPGGAF